MDWLDVGEDVGLVEEAEETVGVVDEEEDMASQQKGRAVVSSGIYAESARRRAVLPVLVPETPASDALIITDHHMNMILWHSSYNRTCCTRRMH